MVCPDNATFSLYPTKFLCSAHSLLGVPKVLLAVSPLAISMSLSPLPLTLRKSPVVIYYPRDLFLFPPTLFFVPPLRGPHPYFPNEPLLLIATHQQFPWLFSSTSPGPPCLKLTADVHRQPASLLFPFPYISARSDLLPLYLTLILRFPF